MACQQGGFLSGIGQRHVHDVHRQQLGLAGIEAAFVHMQVGDVRFGDAQRLGGQGLQGGQRVRGGQAVGLGFGRSVGGAAFFDRQRGQGQFQFGQADHGIPRGPW
jgi:hypothetical protein